MYIIVVEYKTKDLGVVDLGGLDTGSGVKRMKLWTWVEKGVSPGFGIRSRISLFKWLQIAFFTVKVLIRVINNFINNYTFLTLE